MDFRSGGMEARSLYPSGFQIGTNDANMFYWTLTDERITKKYTKSSSWAPRYKTSSSVRVTKCFLVVTTMMLRKTDLRQSNPLKFRLIVFHSIFLHELKDISGGHNMNSINCSVLKTEHWTKNISGSWLNCFKPLKPQLNYSNSRKHRFTQSWEFKLNQKHTWFPSLFRWLEDFQCWNWKLKTYVIYI